MSTLAFPAEFPVVADAETVAADLMSFFYSETDPDESLAIINGLLDDANLHPALEITADLTQRGSAIEMHRASGTANLDYKSSLFGDFDLPIDFTGVGAGNPAIPIPGGCVTRYCKWANGKALVMWTVYWTAVYFRDNDDLLGGAVGTLDPTVKAALLLMHDGVQVASQLRTQNILGDSNDTPQSYRKARVWSGHALIDIDKGDHNIGLAVIADSNYRAIRIHAINIDVVMMKRDTTMLAGEVP